MESTISSVVDVSDSVNVGSSSSSEIHHQEIVVVEEDDEEEGNRSQQGQGQSQDQQHYWHRHRHGSLFHRLNLGLPFSLRTEACSVFLLLVAFWIFVLSTACLTVILGFYGPSTIQLEPNLSRLIKANPFFVQSIQVREEEVRVMKDSLPGPMLYGFREVPPLNVLITWSEEHDAVLESGDSKVWQYFLNPGSKVHVSYSVKRPRFSALSLVIAQGRDSLVDWIEDPSYPNTTLSWNIIHGNGTIELELLSSDIYYIALANLNFQEGEVQLNFTIEALTYNTTQAYYKCSPSHHVCTFKLDPFGANAAVLTSPGPELGMTNYKGRVKLRYCQRWISYLIGSASVTVFIMIIIKISSAYCTSSYGIGLQAERTALLSARDDDSLSLGSSYDSLSQEEEERNESLAVTSQSRKQLEGESKKNNRNVCTLCSDAHRDCFFIPCGHSAACFTCGTRVIEEAGKCPVCCRTPRKVRRIFSV